MKELAETNPKQQRLDSSDGTQQRKPQPSTNVFPEGLEVEALNVRKAR